MAYEKQTWDTGDVITAEKLNHIEAGIENEQVGPQGPPGEKGDPGPQGNPGTAGTNATITSASATVDNTSGTPAVEVTLAGADAPVITGCTINVNGTTISGQLTMSSGDPIPITGTYTAAE